MTSSSDEYFTDSDTETDLNYLVKKCLDAKPEMMSSTNSAIITRSSAKKKNGELLPDHFLRSQKGKNQIPAQNADSMENLLTTVSDELKNDMSNVSSKLDSLLSVMNHMSVRINDIEEKVCDQDSTILLQNEKIVELESKIEDNESKLLQNKVILTHKNLNANSTNLRMDVIKFFEEKMKLPPDVIYGFTVSKFGTGAHTLLVEFSVMKHKRALYKARRALWQANDPIHKDLFINDFLTKKRAELMKLAREMKKKKQIHAAFSHDGNVFIKKDQGSTMIKIRDASDLPEISDDDVDSSINNTSELPLVCDADATVD